MPTTPIKVVLFGAAGRMGMEILAANESGDFQFVGGIVSESSASRGRVLPGCETPLTDSWAAEFDGADVIIDFSSRAGTIAALEAAYQHSIPLLVGTTGLGEDLEIIFEKVASKVPVVRASNTSVGVNALIQLAQAASAMLGADADVEIVESHHRMKKDAPSGTALTVADAIRAAREVSGLQTTFVKGREGDRTQRASSEIGIHAVRGGDVVGEHTVMFLADGERIEITHRAMKRSIFAKGALRAAKWLVAQRRKGAIGVFTMRDVLRS